MRTQRHSWEGGICCQSQGLKVIGKAVSSIFHKYENIIHAGDFIKTQVFKENRRFHFSIEKQSDIAARILYFDEMCEDFI